MGLNSPSYFPRQSLSNNLFSILYCPLSVLFCRSPKTFERYHKEKDVTTAMFKVYDYRHMEGNHVMRYILSHCIYLGRGKTNYNMGNLS